jgi:hypothetical protein
MNILSLLIDQSYEPSERSELQVELAWIHAQFARKPGDLPGGTHQGEADTFLFLLGKFIRFHAPDRLQLQQTPQELDQGKHESCQIVLDPLRIEIDRAAGGRIGESRGERRVQVAGFEAETGRCAGRAAGGHGDSSIAEKL